MSPIRTLVPYLRPHTLALFLAALCVVASAGAAMAMVPLARYAADAFGHLTLGALNLIVLGLIGLFALRGVFAFLQAALSSHVALAATAHLREDVFARLMSLDLAFHRANRPADLGSRLVQDVGLVKEALAAVLAELIPSVIVIVYALGYVFYLNWHLALATALGAPLVGWAIAQFGSRLHDLSGEGQAEVSAVLVQSQESLSAVALVRVFGREAEAIARFTAASQRHRRVFWRAALVGASQSPVIATLQTAALGGVLWVGGWEILHGRLAPADLIAFAAAIGIAVDPTLAVSHAWSRIQIALAGAERVVALLNLPLPPGPPADAPPLLAPRGALAAHGVAFRYQPDLPILSDVHFEIAPGARVALIGPSGGGKSTLAALLVRLERPTAGMITLDGRDLLTIPTADLHRAIAYVPQDSYMFAATVAENLRLGAPSASDEDLAIACHIAQADGFVRDLANGYQTPVGEGGMGLSGGQRQRLAIARALLVKPAVLVLDEATSALDAPTESAILAAIQQAFPLMTLVCITHRLASVAHFDQVLEIEAGRLRYTSLQK